MTVFLKKKYFNVLLNKILVNYQRKKRLIAIMDFYKCCDTVMLIADFTINSSLEQFTLLYMVSL